jgi:hypothetical protein
MAGKNQLSPKFELAQCGQRFGFHIKSNAQNRDYGQSNLAWDLNKK